MKKGGKCILFPQLVKVFIFFPNWLKVFIFFPQLTWNVQNCNKKGWDFSPAARTPHNKFHLGKKYKLRRGGAKIWISNLIYTPGYRWRYCSNIYYEQDENINSAHFVARTLISYLESIYAMNIDRIAIPLFLYYSLKEVKLLLTKYSLNASSIVLYFVNYLFLKIFFYTGIWGFVCSGLL